MFRKTILTIAAAASLALTFTGAAEARRGFNGIEPNGLELNGLELNRRGFNGLELNGVESNRRGFNGVELNRRGFNGVELNRRGFNGVGMTGFDEAPSAGATVISIELPKIQ